jgi:glutaredoxin
MLRALLFVVASLALAACADKPQVPDGPPPFSVRDQSEGLMLVYGDQEGFHTVQHPSDVPAASRAHVRVDSLSASPDRRLDPQFVWVADLRRKGADGTYSVRALPREEFERLASGRTTPAGSGEVVVYGASWCGVCRQAEAYFRSRNVAFVEKDIEREPGAREEMMRKANAAGISTRGIPVIDVRGTILAGFDPRAIDRALQ